MPIYIVIYSIHNTSFGIGIKHIYYVIPTTLEEADNVVKKYCHIVYNTQMQYTLQIEYVARHDEELLEKAAKESNNV